MSYRLVVKSPSSHCGGGGECGDSSSIEDLYTMKDSEVKDGEGENDPFCSAIEHLIMWMFSSMGDTLPLPACLC